MLNAKTILIFAMSAGALGLSAHNATRIKTDDAIEYQQMESTLFDMQSQLGRLSDVSLQIKNEEDIKKMETKIKTLEEKVNAQYRKIERQEFFIAENRKQMESYIKTIAKFKAAKKRERKRLPSRQPKMANKSLSVKLLSINTLSSEKFVTLKSHKDEIPSQITIGESFKGWVIREIDNPIGTAIISRGKNFKTLRVVH